MSNSTFSRNLRSFRTARGLTQAEMSRQLHVQRQTYCNYENGHRLPSLEMTAQIAGILDVDLQILITGRPGKGLLEDDDIRIPIEYQQLPAGARANVRKYIQLQKKLTKL